MSEAKWRDLNSVSEHLFKQGSWHWHSKNGHVMTCPTCIDRKWDFGMFLSNVSEDSATQVYGPIPDPPKILPKTPPTPRRFTAIYAGQPVSGAYHQNECIKDLYRIWFWQGDHVSVASAPRTALTNFKWIDGE